MGEAAQGLGKDGDERFQLEATTVFERESIQSEGGDFANFVRAGEASREPQLLE